MDATSIRQILFNIESVNEVSLYELDDLLLWPDIRFNVLMIIQSILAKREFYPQVLGKWSRRWRFYSGLIRTIPLAIRPSLAKHKILHIIEGDYYRYKDNKLYSPNISPLREIEPQRSLLLDLSPRPPHLASSQHSPVKNMYWVDFLIQQLLKRYLTIDRKKKIYDWSLGLASTIEKEAEIILSSEVLENIRNRVLYRHAYCLAGINIWRKILQKISPSIINLMCGHYGHSPLILAAHDLNITVCEKQHGMATRRHPAYNHAPSLCTSNLYKKYFPDYFLIYGEYWKKCINIPGMPTVLGNPYLQMKKKNFSSGNNILVCLDSNYELLKNFIIKIAQYFPRKIIVRPHPALAQHYKRAEISKIPGIDFDCSPDIYDTLKKSEVVIAEASTVLFEAAALGLRVFRVKTDNTNDFFSDFPFLTVKSPDEMFEFLSSDEIGKISDRLSNFLFSDNWENNYYKFIVEHTR